MAMIGVTCRMMAKGNSARSSHFDCATSSASATPQTVAMTSASKVTPSVTSSDENSSSRSSMSLARIALGAGRM